MTGQFSIPRDNDDIDAFVDVLTLQQALTTIGKGDVNVASVMAALHTLKNYTAGGLTGPLTFHSGAHPGLCSGMAIIQNHKWMAMNNGALTCSTTAGPLPD